MHEVAQQAQGVKGHFFDSVAVEALIGDYQRSESPELMGEIIRRCEPVALSLIRSRCTALYEPETDLLAAVNEKLLWSLPRFDPQRGRAFAYVSRTVINTLCTRVSLSRKHTARYTELDDALIQTTPDEGSSFSSRIAVADLTERVRGIRSACKLAPDRLLVLDPVRLALARGLGGFGSEGSLGTGNGTKSCAKVEALSEVSPVFLSDCHRSEPDEQDIPVDFLTAGPKNFCKRDRNSPSVVVCFRPVPRSSQRSYPLILNTIKITSSASSTVS
jgi:hypothetical protein